MSAFQNILVPVDFSDTSDEAWRVACDLARTSGSFLHLLHVAPDPLSQAWAVETVALDYSGMTRQWIEEAEAKLAAIQPGPGIEPARVTRVVASGAAYPGIMEYANRHAADLIVMGTHGYGPVMHLLLGSVAERVVRHASCPVLTVPHRSLRKPVPVVAEPELSTTA
jgi:nucleotide-binding universal stress UspA family protein